MHVVMHGHCSCTYSCLHAHDVSLHPVLLNTCNGVIIAAITVSCTIQHCTYNRAALIVACMYKGRLLVYASDMKYRCVSCIKKISLLDMQLR
jgi:hypothetical protein